MPNVIQHALTFFKNFPVCEPYDAIAAWIKIGRALGIIGDMAVFAVLVSIEFDDHFGAVAGKIDDVTFEGDLPPKMKARLFEFAQFRPQNAFRIGLVVA